MRFAHFRRALLILTLALGQWLLVAHAMQHPVLAPDQACQICLHAQGLDSAAVAEPTAALALAPASESPAVTLPAATPAQPAAAYPIRGPPRLS